MKHCDSKEKVAGKKHPVTYFWTGLFGAGVFLYKHHFPLRFNHSCVYMNPDVPPIIRIITESENKSVKHLNLSQKRYRSDARPIQHD